VIRTDGKQEELGFVASTDMQPGDVFVIETPGGGGYGAPEEKQKQDEDTAVAAK
jgi:5-oxoprolinase (ATP-hydrolysing)